MEILLVTSELYPFVPSADLEGGVGDIGKSLKQIGHDVTIVTPFGPGFEQGGLLVARRLTPLTLGGERVMTVYDAQLSTQVKLVLLGLPAAVEPPLSTASPLSAATFESVATFTEGVVALIQQRAELGQRFEAVHLFDWCAAPVAALLAKLGEERPRVVLSVRDVELPTTMSDSELRQVSSDRLALFGVNLRDGEGMNLLCLGLPHADTVVVSSTALALALHAKPPSEGSGCWAALGERLVGVGDGVDYARVNPATNPMLVARFDAVDPTNKAVVKGDFLRRVGFELEEELPLVVVPGPLDEPNGGSTVLEVLSSLDLVRARVVVLTDPRDLPLIRDGLEVLRSSRGTGHLALLSLGEAAELHRALGAADLVFLPVRREPVGVTHLLSMRYGAVPIASRLGGHADVLLDADAELRTGNAFLFEDTSEALAAVDRALVAVGRPKWPELRRRVMRHDSSWDRSVRRLVLAYRPSVSTIGAA